MDIQQFIEQNNLEYKSTKRTITIYTGHNRIELLKEISSKVSGAIFYPEPKAGSSIGRVRINDTQIVYVKPLKSIVSVPSHVYNETTFAESINIATNYGTRSITIKLESPDRTITLYKIRGAERVATATRDGRKTDIRLYDSCGGIYNVSIKMDNAFCWESATKYFAPIAKPYVERAISDGLVELVHTEFETIYKIKPCIILPATREEANTVIFGSDILGLGCIATKTFTSDDFVFNNRSKTLTINCNRLIETEKDVDLNSDITFCIRNDITASDSIIPGIRGLRIIAHTSVGTKQSANGGVWLNR